MHTAPGKAARGTDLRLLALAFLGGDAAVYTLPHLPHLGWCVPGLLLVLLPGLPRDLRSYLAAACAGALCLCLHAHWLLAGRLDPSLDHHDVQLSGTVVSLPRRRPDRTLFLFEPNPATTRNHPLSQSSNPPMPRRLRVSWYRAGAPVQAGQCWRFTLRVKTPRGLSNPGGFDYEGWLFRNGVGASGYVRGARRCHHPEEHPLLALRARADRAIRRVLPHDPMRGIVLALTLGERGDITTRQWRVFRRTGTSHLVAISGLHVGLVSAVVFFLVRWLWALCPPLARRFAAQRAAALAGLGSASGYALLAGMGLPTQRALVMVGVVMVSLCLGRRATASRLLALALLTVLLANPLALGAPGFWLSFGAVAWILYGMTGRLSRPRGWRAWLRIQLVLGMAMAPLTIYFFGRAPWMAAPTNLILIPLFTVLVPAFLLGVLLLAVWPWAGAGVIRAGVAVLHGLWPAWALLAKAASGPLPTTTPPLPLVLLALAGMVMVLAPRGLPGRAAGLLLCVLVLVWRPAVPAAGGFRLAVLDVGQGLSAVVRTHAHTLVFDTGPAYPGGFDAGRSVVVPYLRWSGTRSLDALVLSHGDMDHRGGAPAVLKRYPAIRRLGWHGQPCRAGRHWRWDGVSFRFLHPDGAAWHGNDRSCVLRVAAGGHAVLLTGDIEAPAEAHLVAKRRQWLRADVLVAPHHGSNSSSTPAFVQAVHPRFVVFPAGWDNRWGFPKSVVVRRYRHEGAVLRTTGCNGAILFRVHAGFVIGPVSWRTRHHRFWNFSCARSAR